MSLVKRLALGCLLCLVTFCYVGPTRTLAQTRRSAELAPDHQDQILQQLLTEVRELRLAVQRATVNNTRFQMLIERVRVQQGHVEALSRQLEAIRTQLSDMRTAQPQMEQQIKDGEEFMEHATDLNRRAELESRIKVMKGGLERMARESDQLRDREAATNSEVQISQAKLNELNAQLDSLMGELKGP